MPPRHAAASATLTDTIAFQGAPVVNFDIDLSSTVVGEGFSSLIFTFGLRTEPFSCGPGP
jgi:hypothetical protein